jgi:c(7)-type cytochrome triheme protein
MSSRVALVVSLVLLAAFTVAGAATAQQLSKLPPDLTLPQSGDSPGRVVFSHQGHVAVQAKPDCTACHPKLAPILKPAAQAKREPLTHAKMLKGQACGACHNGKDARGFDDCAMCHK